MSSSRTYLSIGDVLTLLREEFPDVTISKIRFLESQGLVNPERSPSGYRKFFDHDVERLRWVLRQQREHFLPLKVIRDRLADGELDETGADGGNGKPAPATRPAAASAAPDPTVEEQPTKADEEAMARILADASRRTAQRPDATAAPAAGRRGLQVVDEAQAPPVDAPRQPEPVPVGGGVSMSASSHQMASSGSAASASAARASAPSGGGASGASGTKGGGSSKPPAEPGPSKESRAPGEAKAAPRAGRSGTDAHASTATGADGGGGASAGANSGASMVTGASMTGEEVCAASGLSADELSGLEGFGLITSVNVAGIPTYDEDALTLANLAAQFRAFGIEARHLRLYRNAVDRELGLIEQVIIPLLRQRNPESRQRAVETSDQLAALGQSIRATLLHQALRQHLGG